MPTNPKVRHSVYDTISLGTHLKDRKQKLGLIFFLMPELTAVLFMRTKQWKQLRWTSRQNGAWTHNGSWVSLLAQGHSALCSNTSEPWRHCSMRTRSHKKKCRTRIYFWCSSWRGKPERPVKWENMFTPGRQICSQATMRSYLTPIRLQKPRSPNACRSEWSNKICHMSRVMCEETTPYRVFGGQFGNIWHVESGTPLCRCPLPGTYPREFLTPAVKLWPELLLCHCSFRGKFEATLKVQC